MTSNNSQSVTKRSALPLKIAKDPTLPSSIPTTSKEGETEPQPPCTQTLCKYLYDRDKKTFCQRTCKSWILIVSYSIIYLIFLTTYMFIFLFISLWILRLTTDFNDSNSNYVNPAPFTDAGIGLTATPTASESNYPLIWYRKDRPEDYQRYINALDSLLVSRRMKRDLGALGPCGQSPYGYGDSPCVVIRVNKQFHWAGKPLVANSTETKIAPVEVQKWIRGDKKLWLHCVGQHSYDKEHIGRIRYFPDPPGYDPGVFPLRKESYSPVIAIQVWNITVGLSAAIECKLWYLDGPSTINFMIYVAPEDRASSRRN